MSRCLPFPPPGYVWHGVCGEALLEVIKFQRERVKAEKEEKREKKRRKKEKKKKEKEERVDWRKIGHFKRHKLLSSNEVEEISEIQGKKEYEIQMMETSSLTEEVEQLIYDSLYESSDNNQSIQRKKSRKCCHENSTRGRIVQIDFRLKQQEMLSSASRISMEYKKSKMNMIESKFEELVVNWIPPLMQIEHFDVCDQDWLFERKLCRSNIWDVCNANIYALPYIARY